MILPRFVQSPLLRSVPGFYHAFLGVDPLPGREDAGRLQSVFAIPPSRVGTLRQEHSATVLEWVEGDAVPGAEGKRKGDALFTAVQGTGVGIRTADCVPVLIAVPEVPACAAVHAGWRGLSAGIIGETVHRLCVRFGIAASGGLVAAAGPSARGCCYEIGEEVADVLRQSPGGGRFLFRGNAAKKWMADLPSFALAGLAAAGVPGETLEAAGPCTICSRSFHSFRREKSLTGRQLSFIYITGAYPQ
ncbi:MAG: polyphenol oxidase family protein [Thermodesulfobacteriota bacterium]|nr:polyphenol oxidase family protein [Thermodesulfobacteriota bacterium]